MIPEEPIQLEWRDIDGRPTLTRAKPDLKNDGYRAALKDICVIMRMYKEPAEAIAQVEVFITRYLNKATNVEESGELMNRTPSP